MHRLPPARLLALLLIVPLVALLALPLGAAAAPSATSYTWTGLLSGDWTNPGNWLPVGVPGQGSGPDDTVLLPNIATTYTITNTPQVSLDYLQIQASYVISGSQLTLGAGGISMQGAGGTSAEIEASLNLTTSLLITFENDSSSLELSGLLSGPSGIRKQGDGTLILSSSNTYGGQTTVEDGVLEITANTALGNTTNNVLVQEYGTLKLGSPNMVIGNPITVQGTGESGRLVTSGGDNQLTGQLTVDGVLGGTFDIAAGSSLSAENTVGGFGGLNKLGAGTLTLRGETIYDGATRIEQGILSLELSATLGNLVGATAVITGAQLRIVDSLTLSEKLTLEGSGPDGSGALLAANLQGGFSSVDLRGKVTLKPGDVVIGVADTAELLHRGTIGGGGRLVKSGAGLLKLGGSDANTFSGGTLVRAGFLGLNKPVGVVALSGSIVVGDGSDMADLTLFASHQISNTASVRINENALLDMGGNKERFRNLTMQGSTIISLSGPVGRLRITGKIRSLASDISSVIFDKLVLRGQRVFQIDDGTADEDLILEEEVRGPGSLVKTGLGMLVLCGTKTNTYRGATIVRRGTLLLDKPSDMIAIPGALKIGANRSNTVNSFVLAEGSNEIANTTAVTVNRDGFLGLEGYQDTIAALTLNGGQVVTGGGAGEGRLTLNGNLVAGSSPVRASVMGRLNLGGTRRTISVADGPSPEDLMLERVLGTAGFDKTGAGTLLLSQPNGYGGSTSVSAGTLLVLASGGSATSSGDVIVGSGARLSGTGVISGAVTVLDGGTLAPGDQPGDAGTLGMRSLVLSPLANLAFDLGVPGSSADSDAVATSGSLTLDGVLNVRARPSFGAGSYPIFTYGGALMTNNGEAKAAALTLGRRPTGFNYTIKTSTPGVIKLVVN